MRRLAAGPKKQRDHPALYDTTFAPTAELESQWRVTASFLHPPSHDPRRGREGGGGRRGQDCAQPRTTTKHIATSDLQKQRGRVSECHRLHSVPVTERPCGRRLLVPDGAPSIDALPCGFKKNNEEEKEGPRAPKPVSPISRRLKTGTREIPNQKRKNVAACRLAVGSPSLRSVLLWDRSD